MIPETELMLAGVLYQLVERDTDYAVRYGLVLEAMNLAHKAGYPAGFGWDSSEDPELDGFRVVAYIQLPTGQVSWHMPEHGHPWDGHTTEEKHTRIHAYCAARDLAGVPRC